MSNLSGVWLGTYWQGGKQTRFEMTLVQSGNKLIGNILDNGRLGEAELSGEVVGRTIQFSKRYLMVKQTPVNYRGTVSEDGNKMSGKWDFYGILGRQKWEAHRNGENLALQQKVTEQKALQLSVR